VLLISSIAGVIIHIPAGIGVLEAVFLALLRGEHAGHGQIIAALLAYRVLYFIVPLLLALVLYLWLESRAKHLRVKNEQKMQQEERNDKEATNNPRREGVEPDLSPHEKTV